jgi:hypothetical protein
MTDLDEGYAAMAADPEREAEAMAWLEGSECDFSASEGSPDEER